MISIDDLKKDILQYDLYWVVDDIPYGDYRLTIINKDDKVIIAVYDERGSAAYAMDREEFLNINTTEELKKYINSVLYYNYIYEGE